MCIISIPLATYFNFRILQIYVVFKMTISISLSITYLFSRLYFFKSVPEGSRKVNLFIRAGVSIGRETGSLIRQKTEHNNREI